MLTTKIAGVIVGNIKDRGRYAQFKTFLNLDDFFINAKRAKLKAEKPAVYEKVTWKLSMLIYLEIQPWQM